MESLKALQKPSALIEDFIRDCRLRDMTGEIIRRYVSSLRIFAKFLEEQGLNISDVNVNILRNFLQHVVYRRKAKNKTIENYFSCTFSLL